MTMSCIAIATAVVAVLSVAAFLWISRRDPD